MQKMLLKSKIHRATVTDANIEYEGSITIDHSLMEEAAIQEYEKLHIWDVTNGERVETYAIKGEPNSGTICINGAAAHRVKKGDIIIIASYGIYSEEESKGHKPIRCLVDPSNKIKSIHKD